jgi:hypothetical protein
MALLPAVVPQLVEKRSELVPARLARKVAPLFGIPSEQNPFRPMTWVCDFTAITVSEIARGAPLPTRTHAAELRSRDDVVAGSAPWTVDGRAVMSSAGRTLPNEIVAATINRFGPDTKAAIVLTATNVLLTPVTEAIATALPMLRAADGGELPTVHWIAAWAAVAVEVYRSQPALVTAAIKARAIQRESLDAPQFPWADRLATRQKARCEMGAAADDVRREPVTRPRNLDFLDLAVNRLNATGAMSDAPLTSDQDVVPPIAGPGVGDRLADLLLGLMVDMGTPDSVGYVWVSERETGQAVVEAMVPSSGLVREVVESWAHGPGLLERPDQFADALADTVARPIRLPDPGVAAALPMLARRALVLAGMGIVRQMGLLAPSAWVTGPEFARLLDGLTALVDHAVDRNDPLVPEITLRVAVQRTSIQRHDGQIGPATVAKLLAAVDDCLAAGANGVLDRGTLADLLSVACIELNALRAMAPHPELIPVLRRYWAAFAETIEVDLFSRETDHSNITFQLHNYAAFLGGNKDNEDDLRGALHLFAGSVLPGRTRLYNRGRDIRPLARSLYLAADAAAALAELLTGKGESVEAEQWVLRAFDWIQQVLSHKLFSPGQLHPRLNDCLFSLRAAPVLLLAVETGVTDEPQSVLNSADELIRLLERWLKENTDGKVEQSRYHGTVTALRARVNALLANT